MKTGLIPEVKEMTLHSGMIRLDEYSLSKEIREYVPIASELVNGLVAEQSNRLVILRLEPAFGEEEYSLTIQQEFIHIGASTPKAVYYALCTLTQLAWLNHGSLDCCAIHDSPTYAIRGFSDDISRGQISNLENFKSIIRRLAFYKCNVYMPYIEDTFLFESIPESGKYSNPVGAQEWRTLVTYAENYFVRIVPIINLFAHWEKNAALGAFRDFLLAKDNDPLWAHRGTLDVRKPEVRAMVQAILDEIVAVFGRSGIIHAGGDEVGALELFSKEEAGEIYNDYYRFIRHELEVRGCRMMMYSDMYTPVYGDYQVPLDCMDEMPKDIQFVYWDYTPRHEYRNIDELVRRDRCFHVSPASYTWNRFVPQLEVAWHNTRRIAGYAPDHCSGLIMSSWNDGGMTLREENWFSVLIGASFGWHPGSRMTYTEYIEKFFDLYFGLKEIDLTPFNCLFGYGASNPTTGIEGPEEDHDMERRLGLMLSTGEKLYVEFWKDARLPVDPEIKARTVADLRNALSALAYFNALKPLRNKETYDAMLFDMRRLTTAIRKVALLKDGAYLTREEAMKAIPDILEMAREVSALHEENDRLWHATNRRSEWDFCDYKYLELEDSFHALARYCRVAKWMKAEKFL